MLSFLIWLGFVSYTSFVFWASTTVPSADVARLIGPYDKIIHFAMYSLLFFFAASSFHRSPLRRFGRAAALALAYSAAVGAATEWLQSSIPGRAASGADFAADLAGAGSSAAFLWAFRAKLEAGYF